VDTSFNSSVIASLENDNKCLQNTIKTLITRISILENEIKDLKNNTENSDNKYEYLCAKLRGQQKLTSYPGFSKQDPTVTRMDTEPHIILKIEEKNIDIDIDNTFTESLEKELLHDATVEEEESEEEEEESEEEESEEEEEEEVVKEEVVKEEEVKGLVKEESEEEESEEEVQTEEEQEEQEQEEEVFEIEIDDITYFATDEENGILYAMTKDGDVGEKVGIIKEGEPIFS
jgi:hypothetical protein